MGTNPASIPGTAHRKLGNGEKLRGGWQHLKRLTDSHRRKGEPGCNREKRRAGCAEETERRIIARENRRKADKCSFKPVENHSDKI